MKTRCSLGLLLSLYSHATIIHKESIQGTITHEGHPLDYISILL